MLLNKHNFALGEYAKDGGRFAFDTIRVTPEGTYVTDGCFLIHVTAPKLKDEAFPVIEGFKRQESPTTFLLNAADAKKVAKAIPSERNIPILNNAIVGQADAERVSIAVTDLDTHTVFQPKVNKGKYPSNVERALNPLEPPVFRIAFSPEYLRDLAKSALQFTNSYQPMVVLSFYGADKPTLFETKNSETGQEWKAVLMSMRLPEEKK